MKGLAFFLTGFCWTLQACSAAPAQEAIEKQVFQLKPDSDSLVELTHWTTQGFLETGITNETRDSRIVFELARGILLLQKIGPIQAHCVVLTCCGYSAKFDHPGCFE